MGEGGRDTCPQARGRGVEVEHEGGNGVVHRAVVHRTDPAQAVSLGTPGSYAFLGRRPTFLEGPRGVLSHTAAGAGADHSLSPTLLIAVPCFPPSTPLYIYPPSASARCWRRPQRRSPPHPGTEPPGLPGTPERGMGA